MFWTPSNGIVNDGLVLYLDAGIKGSYPGSGTTWTDLAGNNDGTLTNGPTYSSADGGSIVFDGSNDRVEFSSWPAATTELSVSFWYKPHTTKTHWLINKSPSTGLDRDFTIRFGDTGDVNFWFGDNNPNYVNLTSASTYTPNQWLHITATRDGSNAKIYWNGVEDASVGYSFTPTDKNHPFDIGWYPADFNSSRYPDGNLARVLWYNRALSAAEIAQNFEATRGRFGI